MIESRPRDLEEGPCASPILGTSTRPRVHPTTLTTPHMRKYVLLAL